MSVILIIFLLFAHWVSDFVLQSSNMATNKSKSNYWLTLHVLTYSVSTMLFWIPAFLFHGNVPIENYVLAFGGIFAFHWVTDYYTSRVTSKLYAKNDIHNFFVVIGFDQVLHFIQIFVLFSYFSNYIYH